MSETAGRGSKRPAAGDEAGPSCGRRERNKKDAVRIVGCQLHRITRNHDHLDRIRDAVVRTHRATTQASELLNLHVRRLLEANLPLPPGLFGGNWAKQAWVAVSSGRGHVDTELRATRDLQLQLQGDNSPPLVASGRGSDQLFKAAADQFVSTAKTGLWFHFRKRVRSVVDCRMALSDAEYNALDTAGRKAFKARKLRVAYDVCRIDTEDYKSTDESGDRALVDAMRAWLELDSIAAWNGKPLEYHAKASPLRFVRPTWRMLQELKSQGRKGFSLLPLRRCLTPKYATIDTKALRMICGLGVSTRTKEMNEAAATKRQKLDLEDPEYGKRAAKGTPEELSEGHWEAWDAVFDFSKALRKELCGLFPKNRRELYFGFSMATDGVGVSLKFTLPEKQVGKQDKHLKEMPTRGLWAIDQLKHLCRAKSPVLPKDGSPQSVAAMLDQQIGAIQAIGVDPGKTEIAVAADPAIASQSRKIRTVRYTAAQRRFETAHYRFLFTGSVAKRDLKAAERRRKKEERPPNPKKSPNESRHDLQSKYDQFRSAAEGHASFVKKPDAVSAMEHTLASTDAKSSSVDGFGAYVAARAAVLQPLLEHYEQLHHRKLRWRGRCEGESSVAKFIERLKGMRREGKEHLVVAWGAWGMTAGRPGQVANKGKAPCLGVGLMKRVAKELVVVKTPEHMTSQTCCRCGDHCGRHSKVEFNRVNDHPHWRCHEIRGLRLCENSECRKPLNRDANAAVNIGTNFMRLYCGMSPIASMDTEDAELTALQAEELQEETD